MSNRFGPKTPTLDGDALGTLRKLASQERGLVRHWFRCRHYRGNDAALERIRIRLCIEHTRALEMAINLVEEHKPNGGAA